MGVAEADHQTFGEKNALRMNSAAVWENGKHHQEVGVCIARNRILLLEKFREVSTHTSFDGKPRFVTFAQAKSALDGLLY
mmetsp:Transcript_13876/g.21634  ORF Transcript_13876/g.21634 Transcript_13876/m.21634 type:complete len:80 (-) Transcript_13876:256-495(-)